MGHYNKMTVEDFLRILADLINDEPASALLSVPGVYELVAEHYNNDVLGQWEKENE
jgi:hypothetical protein